MSASGPSGPLMFIWTYVCTISGDLWSYNYLKEEFVVSPEPDVSVVKLDPSRDKCLVVGSDGLWNMLSAEDAVNMVFDLEYQFEQKVINDPVSIKNKITFLKGIQLQEICKI